MRNPDETPDLFAEIGKLLSASLSAYIAATREEFEAYIAVRMVEGRTILASYDDTALRPAIAEDLGASARLFDASAKRVAARTVYEVELALYADRFARREVIAGKDAEIARLKARAALVPEVEAEWREPDIFGQEDREYVSESDEGNTALTMKFMGDGWAWGVFAPHLDEMIVEGTAPTRDDAIRECEAAARKLGVIP